MKTERRTYTAAFKHEALELWRSTDKSAAEIERELGITAGLLAKWNQRAKAEGAAAFPGQGKLSAEQARIRELERELAITRQERDILKKAVAIFGKDAQ